MSGTFPSETGPLTTPALSLFTSLPPHLPCLQMLAGEGSDLDGSPRLIPGTCEEKNTNEEEGRSRREGVLLKDSLPP